ncbi:MAG TPA: 1-deoxy-D-xylulose-5-phosphate reductoisomerase [Terriglobales bacterium]|nr:1-deoxy-D-xylulose-5-phosphate reductoisomerase [Terriglobales bacterium]
MHLKRIAVLGSTGSIGVTTLDVVGRFPDRFTVTALAAGRNVERLAQQLARFAPRLVAVGDAIAATELRRLAPDYRGEILVGEAGLCAVAAAADNDLVVAGLVGALGLMPTLAALRAGTDVALANKETLVVAGALMTAAADAAGARLFPIDSEHNAIFQALQGHRREDVARVVLTASGGPFRRTPTEHLSQVTAAEALRHPTWKMGDKITIDCSTLMNKGLEVIEAHWLFGMPADKIAVVIHPQSIVHSMVEYIDGSVIAQLGIPDMAIPISYILAHPGRLPLPHLPRLSLPDSANLEFHQPDFEKFPCLGLAYGALRQGGAAPAALNAANEVAVAAFLNGSIGFVEIAAIVAEVLESLPLPAVDCIETLMDVDRQARDLAAAMVERVWPRSA